MSASRRGLPAAAAVPAPADKRFRRSDVGRDRPRRLSRTTVTVVRWTVPALAALALVAWLADEALTSRLFAVRRLAVVGNARLSAGEVEALLGGVRGQNIFRVNLDQARRRVMDSPWVASVSLQRVLPSTLDIHVVERTPLAIARLGQQLYLVDDAGVIIDEYTAGYRQFDLPIVDGLVSSPSAAGATVDRDRVHLTSSLLGALAASPVFGARVSQVDVSNPHDAIVLVGEDPAWLHLGETRFVERLTTYVELAPTLKERFQDIDYVDLRFDDHVYVHARGQPGRTASGAARGT